MLDYRGGSRYGPNRHPPFWQLNHANSADFGAILATRPLFTSTRPPLYKSWIWPWISHSRGILNGIHVVVVYKVTNRKLTTNYLLWYFIQSNFCVLTLKLKFNLYTSWSICVLYILIKVNCVVLYLHLPTFYWMLRFLLLKMFINKIKMWKILSSLQVIPSNDSESPEYFQNGYRQLEVSDRARGRGVLNFGLDRGEQPGPGNPYPFLGCDHIRTFWCRDVGLTLHRNHFHV